MNETNAAEKVIEYRLHIDGLFGRNRKPKRTNLHLGDVPAGTTMLGLETKVATTLVELKAKPGLLWRVIATPVTIEKNIIGEHAYISRSFTMFDGVKVLAGQVA